MVTQTEAFSRKRTLPGTAVARSHAASGSASAVRATPTISDPVSAAESTVSTFLETFVAADMSFARYVLRHPRQSSALFTALRRLPIVEARLDAVADGPVIKRALLRNRVSREVLLGLTAVLAVPTDGPTYSLGPSKQTLRRKTRVATKFDVQWAAVDNEVERRRLLAMANDQERTNPRTQYRVEHPNNDDLLKYDLWLAAYSSTGAPLLLSVTPISGEWGLLRYFRTLDDSPEASAARYLMTQVLVEHLAERGVRYLVDSSRPNWLPNGLRHFQRMVGFRLTRVRVTSLKRAARP